MKLNVLLAVTDALGKAFKAGIQDYGRFFTKNQGAFLGEKRTYSPKEGTVDEPRMRGNIIIQTTVKEKINWFIESTKEYIDALFSQEATNAAGIARAELIVEGKSWGDYSSLELLRLKSLLENSGIGQVIAAIPVRSDAEEWDKSESELYAGRGVYESPLQEGTNNTTVKEDYILKDPNVSEDSPNYNAVVAQKTTTVVLGDYTHQRFSGQWTQRKRAEAARRKHALSIGVLEALKVCNNVEAIPSNLTGDKIFGYIFDGQ